MAKKTPENASPVAQFEQSLESLEHLVEQMETGDLSLEASLSAYERGVGLYRQCQQALEQAELRVRLLTDPAQPETAEPSIRRPMTVEARFAGLRERIESQLDAALPSPTDDPRRLHQAMRHSVLGGGKRMRPLLVHAAAQSSAPIRITSMRRRWQELIHAYSLVHDDLPAMDDDALRRGKPTTHIAFDEATAILAGDALQSRAYSLLAEAPLPAELRVQCLQTLAHAAGAAGMCGGQALDIDATGQMQSLQALTRMHALKTGALIRAAVRMGALCGLPVTELQRLDRFADALGLAFQVRDDILDVEASSEQLGKTAGKDVAQDKSTFPALLGMEGAKARLRELSAAMDEALAGYGEEADALRALGRLAVERDH